MASTRALYQTINETLGESVDSWQSRLRRNYLLATILIVSCILVGGQILRQSLAQQERDAHIINIAGAQRMLSQRVVALAQYTFGADTPEAAVQYEAQLSAAIQRMRTGHDYLTQAHSNGPSPSNSNATLSRLYSPEGVNLAARVTAFLDMAEKFLSQPDTAGVKTISPVEFGLTLNLSTQLLKDLDRAVTGYETAASNKLEQAKLIHAGSIALVIVIILIEGLFIFLPLARKVAGELQEVQALAQNRAELLSSSMQASMMGYWHFEVANPDSIWFSEELGKLYGVSDTQKWYKIEDARSLIKESNSNEIAEAAQRGIQTGEKQTFVTHVVCHDGRELDTFTLIFPTFDDEGNVTKLTGVVRDITEGVAAQKKTRETLALVEQKSRDLTEAHELGRTAMWRMPLGSQELELSKEAYTLMRYDYTKKDEYKTRISDASDTGTHLKALCVDDSYERLREAQRATLTTGEAQTVDIVARRGDYSLADISVRIKLQRGDDGMPMALLGTIQDISDRREAERQLEQLAYYDHLTGLANRALCTRRLKQLCKTANKRHHSAALVLIDLDNFKEINDGLGHQAGDEFLCEIARRINQVAGPRNFTARLGGDEFAVLIESAESVSDIEALVGSILNSVTLPVTLGSADAGGGASAGICMIPNDTCVSEEALRFADLALYEAKNSGRNRFDFFDSAMSAKLQRRLGMSRDLKAAIGTPALQTHYQPIISGATGKVSGFETLMRWQHPEKGWISPAAFIPVAESSHLIGDIGEFAIIDACTQAAKWAKQGKPFEVSVNVSAAQLWQGDLEKIVEKAIQVSGVDPGRLCIELTESVFIGESVERIEAILKRLKARGILLALDDFGTGYSSLGYLNNLPFDKLKIDRCFVSGADVFEERYQLLEGIVGLARGLKMEVVAEGIETADELKIVRALGCDGIQGFYYGKAEPASVALETAQRIDGRSDEPFDADAVREQLTADRSEPQPVMVKSA